MGAVPSHAFVRNLDDAILPDLWRRRTQLSGDEMVSMVELVRRALRTYHPLELQALGEDKEELVAQFIYAKVLRLAPEFNVDCRNGLVGELKRLLGQGAVLS